MDGYDRLAALIGTYPEHAIFRKFQALSIKCLLYRQAELTRLEYELQKHSKWDRDVAEKSMLCRSWYDFTHHEADEDLMLHREKVDALQKQIQDYHNMMLQTTEVLKLSKGKGANLENIKKWLALPKGGDNFLDAIEIGPWSGEHDDDMATLLPSDLADRFGQKLGEKISPVWHALVGSYRPPSSQDIFGPVWSYSPAAFTFLGNVICMLISFIMPTASIFALNYVHSTLARLLMVAAFIFVFAFTMMFAVGSRRGEVFAATAAFAAIQVVFVQGISNTQNASSSPQA